MHTRRTKILQRLYVFLIFVIAYNAAIWASSVSSSSFQKIRTIKANLLFGEEFYTAGKPDLSGIAFPPGAHTLLTFKGSAGAEEARIILVTPPKDEKSKTSRTPIEISDPVNMAFDTASSGAKGFGLYRLFLLDAKLGQLIAIKANARDVMEPAKIDRFDIRSFGIADPQGMT